MTFLITIIIVSIFTGIIVYIEYRSIYTDSFFNRGNLLLRILKDTTRISVYSEDIQSINQAINSIIDDEFIDSIYIYNSNRKLLSYRFKNKNFVKYTNIKCNEFKSDYHNIFKQKIILETKDNVILVAVISPSENIINDSIITDKLSESTDIIGYIFIALTKSPINRAINIFILKLLSFIFIIISMSAIMVFYFTKKLITPLNVLTTVISSDTIENLSLPNMYKSNDEIGQLWSAFYTLIISLKSKEDALISSIKEKEILLREIHHRVKNNLQIICGLLQIQIVNIDDFNSKIILNDAFNRIHTMALIHSHIYDSTNFSTIDFESNLNSLINGIIEIFNNNNQTIKIVIKSQKIYLNISQAIPCALILNELITNSFKHAFIQKSDGIIRVILAEKNNIITIAVIDNGIGFPDEFDITKTQTIGMDLVKRLAKQLNGNLTIKSNCRTYVIIRFDKKA